MHAVQKSIVKSFPPPKSLVSLPRGSFQQHFKNSFQTCSMLRNPRPPHLYTNGTYLVFLPIEIYFVSYQRIYKSNSFCL